eukprot:1581655-Prymnesium_polylepis.1
MRRCARLRAMTKSRYEPTPPSRVLCRSCWRRKDFSTSSSGRSVGMCGSSRRATSELWSPAGALTERSSCNPLA